MWCELLFLPLLSWSYISITLPKTQNMSLVAIIGGPGGDSGRHPLGSSSPLNPIGGAGAWSPSQAGS